MLNTPAPGFAPGGGAGGYRFSEDQAQRIFEELFGSGFGGLGGGMGGMGGGAGGPRVRVFSSGPGGGGGLGRPFVLVKCTESMSAGQSLGLSFITFNAPGGPGAKGQVLSSIRQASKK